MRSQRLRRRAARRGVAVGVLDVAVDEVEERAQAPQAERRVARRHDDGRASPPT